MTRLEPVGLIAAGTLSSGGLYTQGCYCNGAVQQGITLNKIRIYYRCYNDEELDTAILERHAD